MLSLSCLLSCMLSRLSNMISCCLALCYQMTMVVNLRFVRIFFLSEDLNVLPHC